MPVTFDTLNADAAIFSELKKNPLWWKRFKDDRSLYIEVRKDNQVNVYFEGGSIACIRYRGKKLQITTHHKYLGLLAPSKNNLYIKKSGDYFNSCLEDVIARVKSVYSQKKNKNGVVAKEDWGEKYIQGTIIINSRHCHLDSEFAYIDGKTNSRIDFIKCIDGIVTFVEIKRMNDGRMLHETDTTPEVVFQMRRYKEFVEKFSSHLLSYYQKLYDIKKSLGLPVPELRPIRINEDPELLIFDTWEKKTDDRDKHRVRLKEILDKEGIVYQVKTDF